MRSSLSARGYISDTYVSAVLRDAVPQHADRGELDLDEVPVAQRVLVGDEDAGAGREDGAGRDRVVAPEPLDQLRTAAPHLARVDAGPPQDATVTVDCAGEVQA